jgi:2-polyprenyl-3-methyl-5-hydroxy-6-metoxy-1,4-benzoquinol methylase
MNYRRELVKRYYSTQYKHIMPQTAEGWKWVIDRIKLNFGGVFSSIPKGGRILDVACGVDYLENYLLKNGFTRIEAIDLSKEQIQVAKQKLKKYGLQYTDKVKFKIADAFDYLRSARGYNLIAMIDLLEHFQKDKVIELLQLAHNALRKGGFIILRVINADNPMFGRFFYHDFTHETPFTPDSLRQCLSVTGFEIVKISYEAMPRGRSLLTKFKQSVRRVVFRVLGKFIGVAPGAFTEDLIVVARK